MRRSPVNVGGALIAQFALVVLALTGLPGGLPGAPSAAAADQVPSVETVGECADSGQVWLLVVTESGERLRSECVGRPRTGTEALANAEVATSQSKGGYLCTLAGHPQTCPRSFDGTYWQYWHAAGPGARWVHSGKGAGQSTVAPGTIEGWCRNVRGEEYCTLPALQVTDRPSARADRTQPSGSVPWAAVAGVAMSLAVAGVLVRRRVSRP